MAQSVQTSVVNIRRDSYDVYAGRPAGGIDPRDLSPGAYGFLGNPFTVIDGGRGSAIDRFREYFFARVQQDAAFREAVRQAQGKALGCFCHPKACHADVIAAWLDDRPERLDTPSVAPLRLF